MLVVELCYFMQKHNRRKAAKEHVRQKLQENTGPTPQSVHSVQPLDDNDGRNAKLKKCCVSFKLSSPLTTCSCGSVSAPSSSVCGVADAGTVVSEKNKEGCIVDVSSEQNSDLLQSVNSENLWSQLPNELMTSVAELSEPNCHQPNTSCSMSEHNSVSYEHFAAVSCSTAGQLSDVHCKEVSLSENASRLCVSDVYVSEKCDPQIGSSLISSSLKASQKLCSSSTQNVSSALLAGSGGCELNFSSLDDDLLACLVDNDCFPCHQYSAKADVCRKDSSESVAHSVEPDSIGTVASDTSKNRESSVDSDETASLCQALSTVKIAVAESIKSGVTDFTLPDSQYGEMMRLKVGIEDSSCSTVDKNAVEKIISLSCSSSPLSIAGRRPTHRLQQSHWYTSQYTLF